MDRRILGSMTAKGGFNNEKDVCNKINSWKEDFESKQWLEIMGYDIKKINEVKAIQIPTRIKKSDLSIYGVDNEEYETFIHFKKADIQIKIIIIIGNIIKVENLSLKKANSDADYNQIDKRTVDSYQKMWNFDDELSFYLKLFTGEILPIDIHKYKKINIDLKSIREKNRMFLNEFPENIINKLVSFIKDNRILIVSDIFKGRGGLSAGWMLVTKYNKQNDETHWILKDINTVMNFFGKGDIIVSPKGSLHIGKITMQRKGGTPDPTKLQFKINPCKLFELGD